MTQARKHLKRQERTEEQTHKKHVEIVTNKLQHIVYKSMFRFSHLGEEKTDKTHQRRQTLEDNIRHSLDRPHEIAEFKTQTGQENLLRGAF